MTNCWLIGPRFRCVHGRRTYQPTGSISGRFAASKLITTSDEMLQTIISLKR